MHKLNEWNCSKGSFTPDTVQRGAVRHRHATYRIRCERTLRVTNSINNHNTYLGLYTARHVLQFMRITVWTFKEVTVSRKSCMQTRDGRRYVACYLELYYQKFLLCVSSQGQDLHSHHKLNMYIYWFSPESGYRCRRRRRRRRQQLRTPQYNHSGDISPISCSAVIWMMEDARWVGPTCRCDKRCWRRWKRRSRGCREWRGKTSWWTETMEYRPLRRHP